MPANSNVFDALLKEVQSPFQEIPNFGSSFYELADTNGVTEEDVSLAAILSIQENYYENATEEKTKTEKRENVEKFVTMPLRENRHGLFCMSGTEAEQLKRLYASSTNNALNNTKSGDGEAETEQQEEKEAEADNNESIVNFNIELNSLPKGKARKRGVRTKEDEFYSTLCEYDADDI